MRRGQRDTREVRALIARKRREYAGYRPFDVDVDFPLGMSGITFTGPIDPGEHRYLACVARAAKKGGRR